MQTVGGPRSDLLRRAIRLELLTVGWNLVEGVVALAAAAVSGSVALMAFGVDSFVESASGSVLLWRLGVERRRGDACEIESIERRAQKLVAASLVLLTAYIAFDATMSLVRRQQPEVSVPGIILTSVSLGVMWKLASAKRRVARALESRAMEADAFQTTACWWLSLIALAGIAVNAVFGLWWADPVAAIAMTPLLLREAREAWRGEACCD